MEKKETSFTTAVTQESRRAGLSVREKAFADLLLMGWNKMDAYLVVGLYDHVYPIETNKKDMASMMEDKGFVSYTKAREERLVKSGAIKTGQRKGKAVDFSSALSKEEQLRELVAAKDMYDAGSKEWIEIKKMIADITRVKRDEIKEDETTIHYYLPLGCYNCSLYLAERGGKVEKAD